MRTAEASLLHPPPAGLTKPPRLAIVVPCFNEEAVLPETMRRLGALVAMLQQGNRIAGDSHVLFVDDGSRDSTWALIEAAHARAPMFGGLMLSRNCGHQNALLAGLLNAGGDIVVSMDADLQDDVDAVHRMLDAHEAGADIVYGVRSSRATDRVGKRVTARLYYRILQKLGVEIVFDHADYRLMSRRAVEALRGYGETNLFLRALIPQLGFRSAIVTYERAERFAGTSHYPLRKMLSLALEGVTSFSIRPLRLVAIAGFLISLVSLLMAVWALYTRIVNPAVVPGWASIVIPVYLSCGIELLGLGIVGEYVGRIYLEAKARPRFHVARLDHGGQTEGGAAGLDPIDDRR